MDVLERKVMAALTRRGHYPETPDGMAKAVTDALDITAVFRNATPGEEEYDVGEAIYDRLYPGSDLWHGEFDRFEGDQDAVWEVFAGSSET